jgi:hypothetical protein
MWESGAGFSSASALAVLEKPSIRLVLGRLTAITSRSAAHTLVQDWEADEWWTTITRESIRLRQPHLSWDSALAFVI